MRNRTRPVVENCKCDIGTSIDKNGKVWVRLIFTEPEGEVRAYAYGTEGTHWLINSLTTAARIAETSNPSN